MRFSVPLVAAVALAVAAAGCPRSHGPASPHVATEDAPYELDDDLDLAEQADRLAAIPETGDRSQLRQAVAAALVRRLDHELARERLDRADTVVRQLALLWQDAPGALAVEIGPHVTSLVRARNALARAGLDRETAVVLAFLVVADPPHAQAYRDELEQVIEFAESLGTARMGVLGTGSGTISVLEPLVTRLPSDALVDRYVTALVGRANLADATLTAAARSGKLPDSMAIRLAFRASRDLAVALALAHRSDEIWRTIAGLAGVGRTRTLEEAAREITTPTATAVEWAALARAVRMGHDGKDEDPTAARAALAICLDGLVRFPDNPVLLGAAAGHAYDLERLDQPIDLLERARARAPEDAELADRLTSLYRERLVRLTSGDRPHAARARLEELRRYYQDIDRAFPDHEWSTTEADVLAAYGRGLAGVGELAAARSELDRSVRLQPTVEALETLGTIALKLGEYQLARKHLERGAGLGGEEPAAQYARAKLLRLAGDAARGAGDSAGAMRSWHGALEIWAKLGETVELPPALAGERFTEIGKLFWGLGMRDEALENFARAIEADPGGAESHVQIIAYLIMHDEIDRALDVFYDALGSDQVSDYHKVYLCLWILAEDRRAGRADDRLASEYLAGRDGPLWYDDVARLATGRTTATALDARATTRSRRAELTYYRAVLGPRDRDPEEVRRLLEDVVRTDMVLFFEYDMARRHLQQHP